MGDRISIQFKNRDELSVCLFSHWDGQQLLDKVYEYTQSLKQITNDSISKPLDRLEPQTIMVDFIRFLTKDMKIVKSNYYLGRDEYDGDNSNNGNFIINLENLDEKQISNKEWFNNKPIWSRIYIRST